MKNMNTKETLRREAYVVAHGQSVRFRIVKYLVLIMFAVSLYAWKGWTVLWQTFVVLIVLSIAIHLFYRWKTKTWTQSWGGYKKLEIPVGK